MFKSIIMSEENVIDIDKDVFSAINKMNLCYLQESAFSGPGEMSQHIRTRLILAESPV